MKESQDTSTSKVWVTTFSRLLSTQILQCVGVSMCQEYKGASWMVRNVRRKVEYEDRQLETPNHS
jgi:hypothetical protein